MQVTWEIRISGQPEMATRVSVPCSGMWNQSDDLLITSHPSYPAKIQFFGLHKICLLSKRHDTKSLLLPISSKTMKIIYSHPKMQGWYKKYFEITRELWVSNSSAFDMMRSELALTILYTYRNKRRLYLQWALPSSGHPCPWFPLSSWGIGHLCPVWWQRGNCLTFHTTDTHKCFIRALGLEW